MIISFFNVLTTKCRVRMFHIMAIATKVHYVHHVILAGDFT